MDIVQHLSKDKFQMNAVLDSFISNLRKEFCKYTITNDPSTGVNVYNMIIQFEEAYDKSLIYLVEGKTIFPTKDEIQFIKDKKYNFAKLSMAKRALVANASLDFVIEDLNKKFGEETSSTRDN